MRSTRLPAIIRNAPETEPNAGGLVVRVGSTRVRVANVGTMSREERDRIAWDMKQLCYQRGIIPSLGGGH